MTADPEYETTSIVHDMIYSIFCTVKLNGTEILALNSFNVILYVFLMRWIPDRASTFKLRSDKTFI